MTPRLLKLSSKLCTVPAFVVWGTKFPIQSSLHELLVQLFVQRISGPVVAYTFVPASKQLPNCLALEQAYRKNKRSKNKRRSNDDLIPSSSFKTAILYGIM